MKHGFVLVRLVGLCWCLLAGSVVAHTMDGGIEHYHGNLHAWYLTFGEPVTNNAATCLLQQEALFEAYVWGPSACSGGCSPGGITVSGSIYRQHTSCEGTTSTGAACANAFNGECAKHGSVCPAGTESTGAPWYGCAGVEPVPPATSEDPCVGSTQPAGTSSVVDVTNCSVYFNSGGVGVCLGGGSQCWDMYCPSGDTDPNCTPTGWVPTDPEDTYSAVPQSMVPQTSCTEGLNCGGGEPNSSTPPEGAGEPNDPQDPSQGNIGDVPLASSETSSTAPDGTTTTVQNGINFNPYSGAQTETTTTTTTSPDGTSVVEKETTTTKPTGSGAGGSGGTTTTTTVVRTTTAPDGTVTTETSGSTTVEEGDVDEPSDTSASGGGSCEAEPECSGDAVQCAIFRQVWRQNCVFAKTTGGDSCDSPPSCDVSQLGCLAAKQAWEDRCPPAVVDTAGIQSALEAALPADMLTASKVEQAIASDPDYEQNLEVDLSTYSVPDPAPSGSCPLPLSIQVLDQTIEIAPVDLCELLGYISWLVRISASLLAVGIVTGVHLVRSSPAS